MGDSYELFSQLLKAAKALKIEWKCYAKKTGWELKVMGKKRAAFYLLPMENSFHYGMALRVEERELLLANDLHETILSELTASEKIMEGFPLRQVITEQWQLVEIIKILKLVDRI